MTGIAGCMVRKVGREDLKIDGRWGQRGPGDHIRRSATKLGVRLGDWIWRGGKGEVRLPASLVGEVLGFPGLPAGVGVVRKHRVGGRKVGIMKT